MLTALSDIRSSSILTVAVSDPIAAGSGSGVAGCGEQGDRDEEHTWLIL